MVDRLYLDWNATAPLRSEAAAAMAAVLPFAGNASSVHAEGRAARAAVETARAQVASLAGAEAKAITFTSGASEANMLGLTPAIEIGGRTEPRDMLFVSAIEHPSVRAGGRFGQAENLPVTKQGVIDLGELERRLGKAQRPLVSVMHANNETGVIQPIAEVSAIVHAANGLLHVDAVQTAGRIDCDLGTLGADMISISAHKLGGPQGAGALIQRGDLHIADPLIKGGGQERSQRAGTENVAAIAGFGAACATAQSARRVDTQRMAFLRDVLESELKKITPQAVIFGEETERLPNTTCFTVPGIKAETAIIALDLNGIAVSSGSACSSGKVQASHVLAAMGMDSAMARGAVRVSLGWTTREADIGRFLETWNVLSASLLKRGGIAA